MVLPSALPSPPPRLESDVVHAGEILASGYYTARRVVDLAQPDLHQVRYHQERVRSELIPLLDAIFGSTSDAATRCWCLAVTATFTDLFNCLAQHETSTQRWFVALCVSPNRQYVLTSAQQ